MWYLHQRQRIVRGRSLPRGGGRGLGGTRVRRRLLPPDDRCRCASAIVCSRTGAAAGCSCARPACLCASACVLVCVRARVVVYTARPCSPRLCACRYCRRRRLCSCLPARASSSSSMVKRPCRAPVRPRPDAHAVRRTRSSRVRVCYLYWFFFLVFVLIFFCSS